MNLEARATLFNTYPPELMAKILKALREELKENNQLQWKKFQDQYQKSLLSMKKS